MYTSEDSHLQVAQSREPAREDTRVDECLSLQALRAYFFSYPPGFDLLLG
jgi:hypothetical protein